MALRLAYCNPAWLTLLLIATPAAALQPAGTVEEAVTAEVAFTPGDDAARIIVDALHAARRQVLVQAFSFTHRDIARALIEARARGADVRVIADGEQTALIEHGVIPELVAAGIPVLVDQEHTAAHNKVMVIDEGDPSGIVITGSYNFTFAAQNRNAENILLLRHAPRIARAYADNWRRHSVHSSLYRPR